MNYILTCYLLYLLLILPLIVYVGRSLFANGKIFLLDIFGGNTALSSAVNNLLLVGFYLVNTGYAICTLRVDADVPTIRNLVETLSFKTGAIILILGIMHFFNMFILFRLRKRATQGKETSIVHPDPLQTFHHEK